MLTEEILTFISTLIGSLVWPVVAIVITLLFRGTLAELFTSMTRIRASGFGADVEADFREGVERLRSEASSVDAEVANAILQNEGSISPEREAYNKGFADAAANSIDTDRPITNSKSGVDDFSDSELLHRLADLSPRAAILESFMLLERAAMKFESDIPKVGTSPVHTIRALEMLRDEGNLPTSVVNIGDSLRRLRNIAVHPTGDEIRASDAHDYVDTAIRVTNILKMVPR